MVPTIGDVDHLSTLRVERAIGEVSEKPGVQYQYDQVGGCETVAWMNCDLF